MTNSTHHQNHRRASFDITSLFYYSRCRRQQLSLFTAERSTCTLDEQCANNGNSNGEEIAAKRRRSVHELPSQLEFQIDQKLSGRLKIMRQEDGLITTTDANVRAAKDASITTSVTNGTVKDDGAVGLDITKYDGVKKPTSASDAVVQIKPQNNNDAVDNVSIDGVDRTVVVEEKEQSCEGGLKVRQKEQSFTLQQQFSLEETNTDESHNEQEEENEQDCAAGSHDDWKECDYCQVSSILEQISTSTTTVAATTDDADGMERCDEIDRQEGNVGHDGIDTTTTTTNNDDGLEGMPTDEELKISLHSSLFESSSDEEDSMNANDDADAGHEEGQLDQKRMEEEASSPTEMIRETSTNKRHGLILPMVVGERVEDNIGLGLNDGDGESSKVAVDEGGTVDGPLDQERRSESSLPAEKSTETTTMARHGGDGDVINTSFTANANTSNIKTTMTAATAVERNISSSTFHSSKSNASYNNDNKMDLLTEGQYFLSISMLVYMYAHLRETCRMGHTRVKMDEIDCNISNWSSRPGRICSFSSMGSSIHSMGSMSSLQQSQHQQYQLSCDLSNNNNAITAGSIIRIVIDELEDYDKEHANDYYYQANTLHREYEESVMKEFRQWIEQSRVSQMDSNTQDLIADMRKKASKARWKRAMTVMRMSSRLQTLSGGGYRDRIVGNTKNPNEEQMMHYLRRQVAKYRWKRAIAKVKLAVKLNGGKSPNFDFKRDGKLERNQFVSMNNLLQIALKKAPKYFTEGSVMSNLIESKLEVVWLADFTQNDVVYGICVQREEKKITVVFRGTVNAHNWSMNLRYDMMEIPNPVDEYYPGRAETMNLHSGFALYLLRRRKDTRRSKMDEIFEKIEQIGNELAPDGDYKICITGHSMGGALATLFGFFLGAKLRQSQRDKNQELLVYTFASPRVGGESFLYAYQHLERAGMIRHARFSCTNDIVPKLPPCNFELTDLKFYKHVGMRVQLHNTGPIGKWRIRKRLDVSYPLCHDWSSAVARGLMNCILANPNTLGGYKTNHTLTEYQTRLHFALTYRKALGSTVYFLDERRQRLKSLDEYYALRGAMNIGVHSYVYLIPSTDGFNIRKSLTKAFLVMPLIYVWTRLLSKVTCAEIIIPKVAHWVLMVQIPKVVAAIPFLLILQNLLILSFGLTFVIEVIKIAVKIPYRWGRLKKMSGRLMLVSPLLNIWVKYMMRLTNVVLPKNFALLILKHLSTNAHRLIINLRKLVPFYAALVYKLLQLSFGLSFLVVALGISIRTSNQKRRSLSRVLIATLMLVAWMSLFSAACKNITSDVTTAGVSNSNKPGWGLNIERNAGITINLHQLIPRQMYAVFSKSFHRLIPQLMFNLRKLVTFFAGPIYYLLQLSFGLSFVVVALGNSIRARDNRWKRSLGRVFTATLMLVAWVFLFSAAYKSMTSGVTTAGVSISNKPGPGWGLNPSIDNKQIMGHLDNSLPVLNEDKMSNTNATPLAAMQEQLSPIQEYATGIKFAPMLDNGLYLVGAGVRKKAVIKVYAVAMYSTPKVLLSTNTHASLRDAARTFDSTSTMTSFVLEMVYSAGAEKIAGAIAESVKPRYDGSSSDIVTLESLIVKGVNGIGGQATKGTTFRFDCSEEGVNVSVNGVGQGAAAFDGLGSAFVDVFMDGNSVSPTLMDSCVSAWSANEKRSTAEALIELEKIVGTADLQESTKNEPDKAVNRTGVESQLKPIQEYATSIIFDPKLDEGLYLIGAGVRKKSVVKVYAIALYGSAVVLNAASSPTTLRAAARTFDASTPSTSFLLEMVYSASAEKIGGAIADSVKPRYGGPAADIDALESLIVEGVNKKGGQATRGTTFRFNCSEEGVTVTVDGSVQGAANFATLGSAFVDVFLDDNAVSPTLVSSCMDTWSNPEAKAIATSLLELDMLEDDESTVEPVSVEEADEGPSRGEVESQLGPIQEYATGIEFAPMLDNGLYLVGAGVRKKAVIKVYAVAMYSTPKVLLSTNTHASLRDAARTFDATSTMTSFVLEMVYSAGAEKIAGAIAESVKPRYDGSSSDIVTLESLIVKGVNGIGGQATKGTTFRFDCSEEGVNVSVNGVGQGAAGFDGLGSAFVDVFMDGNSVSPTLMDSCVSAWSSEDAKLMATKLLNLDDKHSQGNDDMNIDSSEVKDDKEVEDIPDIATSTTAIEERTETMTTTTKIPSIEEFNEDKVDSLKMKTSSKPNRNLLMKVVKFAFPVF